MMNFLLVVFGWFSFGLGVVRDIPLGIRFTVIHEG
jgi:hypothetical protein